MLEIMLEITKMLSGFMRSFASLFPKLLLAGLVFISFYGAGLIVMRVSHRLSHKVKLPKDIRVLIGQAIKAVFFLIGLTAALTIVGVKLSSILTALGIGGLALGLALKDVLTNLITGLIILINRPFKIKDRIKVLDFEGVVVDINLRYTMIEVGEGLIFIPNQVLFVNPLRVFKD